MLLPPHVIGIKMITGNTELHTNITEYYCPTKPKFTWILSETRTFLIASIILSIASPATIFLNILVITAVRLRRQLRSSANILLASMAVADLLVGAVSMPLSISLDVLLLRKDLSLNICDISFANQLVMYTAVCSSLYHLTVISWERYVAVTKWMEYRLVLHTSRTEMLAVKAWFLSVLTTMPARIMKAAGVQYKYLEIINIIFSLPAVVCMALITYYYVRVYFGMRKTTLIGMSINARGRARREISMAKKTMVLTLSLLISYIPSVIVLLFGKAVPFLRTSSFFRWSELLVQLNSLANPFLYCFALNRRFRQEILSMFNIRKREIRPASTLERRSTWPNVDERDVKNASMYEEEGQQQKHTPETSQPCDDVFLKPYHGQPFRMQEQTSPSQSEVSQVIRVDVHQPKPANERSQMEPSIPNNNNTEFMMREPMPSSLSQVSQVNRVEVHEPKPEKEREQSLPNNNTEFMMREPMPSSLSQVSQVNRVEVHEPKPEKEREQSLPNNNTEFMMREPMTSSLSQVSQVNRVEVVYEPKHRAPFLEVTPI